MAATAPRQDAKTALAKSKKIPSDMKAVIGKYVTTSSRYVNGVLYGLSKPSLLLATSPKASGCSFGADKNGFFVYTHRCRSKSKKSPSLITKTEIDFVESTG